MPETVYMAPESITHQQLDRMTEPGMHLQFAVPPDSKGTEHILQAIVNKKPVYGVTTGLGSRSVEMLSDTQIQTFSKETLLGRAHSVGPPLPDKIIRAAMALRLISFQSGTSAASAGMIQHILDVYNAGLIPDVRGWGSIGAGDLTLGASMGIALMGLGGCFRTRQGHMQEAAEALSDAELSPPPLQPRDGLALANHACFSLAASAILLANIDRSISASINIAALSFLGFQANSGPAAPDVLQLNPQPGQKQASQDLYRLLQGNDYTPRRLQDPLSFRNWPQSAGLLLEQQRRMTHTINTALTGTSDNPAYLPDRDDFVSTGNYYMPFLTFEMECFGHVLSAYAATCSARISKLCTERLSGLPQYLAHPDVGTNGFAPVLKVTESLLLGIQQRSLSPAPFPGFNADGVEDVLSPTLSTAYSLAESLGLYNRLIAIEALVAAQACDLRQTSITGILSPLYDTIRNHSPQIRESRPLGEDIETLSEVLVNAKYL